MTPYPLRRVIACARALMARQGFPRRRAIAAAMAIIAQQCSNETSHASRRRRPDKGERLEYLQHRARTMRARRAP